MTGSPDAACAAIMQSQFGLIHESQALTAGMTRRMIRYRIRSGRWDVLHPVVFRLAGTPTSREQRVMAAGPGRGPLGSTRDLKLSPTSSPRLEDHPPSLRESRRARCDSARSDAGNRSVPDRRRPLRANGRTNGRTGARSGASERSCPPPPFGDALRSFGASGFRDWHCCASFSTIVTRPVR
jgi:hypothetical protein